MRFLATALGVDYDQWLALTRAALKIDLRTSTFVRGPRGRQARAIGALISQLAFYTFTGGIIAAFVWISSDLFLSSTFVVGYVMFMVATATLLDHNAALISPTDYPVLGFRPITSRTYFAARLTNVLVYTTTMTTLFAYLPVVAYFVRWGAEVGLAAILALYGASLFVALAMVALYAGLLRMVGGARLKRLLSYVQFVMSFLVYGGYFFVTQFFSQRMVASMALRKTAPLLLLPPTWFGSYLELAAGRSSMMEILPAAASVVALVAIAATIGGRLSLDYADRLGALASATSAPPAGHPARARRSGRARFFTSGESRAVALLVRSQFANDMKFRMSILAIIPLTIIYLVMGLSKNGSIGDPFVDAEPSQGLTMVTLAMLMFPTMLKMNLGRSDAYRASWIFFATPADRTRLVRAASTVLVATFLVPYLIAVAAVLMYFAESPVHVLIHLLVVGLLSHLVLQIVTLLEPELPFSRPMTKVRSSTRVFVLMGAMGAGAVLLPLAAPVIYREGWRVGALIAVLVIVSLGVERLTRTRIEAQAVKLEFEE